jgi:hypothetical protein
MKKAVSLISAIVFIGFTISVIALVYRTGMPIVEKMQASAEVERIKSAFVDLDDRIQKVASEANGSRRTISFKIEPGDLVVDEQNDIVYWALDTEAPIFSPRTASYYGSLAFGSNLDTKASEDVYSGIPTFVLENEHIKVYVRMVGSPSSPQSYATSDLLVAVYQKDLNQWMDADLDVSINNDPLTSSGSGYTVLEKQGKALPYGRVSAYMNSSFDYYINFTLESGADFIEIEGAAA